MPDTDQTTESLEDRVKRLLRDAAAAADNDDIEGALDMASVAYEDWYGTPRV